MPGGASEFPPAGEGSGEGLCGARPPSPTPHRSLPGLSSRVGTYSSEEPPAAVRLTGNIAGDTQQWPRSVATASIGVRTLRKAPRMAGGITDAVSTT